MKLIKSSYVLLERTDINAWSYCVRENWYSDKNKEKQLLNILNTALGKRSEGKEEMYHPKCVDADFNADSPLRDFMPIYDLVESDRKPLPSAIAFGENRYLIPKPDPQIMPILCFSTLEDEIVPGRPFLVPDLTDIDEPVFKEEGYIYEEPEGFRAVLHGRQDVFSHIDIYKANTSKKMELSFEDGLKDEMGVLDVSCILDVYIGEDCVYINDVLYWDNEDIHKKQYKERIHYESKISEGRYIKKIKKKLVSTDNEFDAEISRIRANETHKNIVFQNSGNGYALSDKDIGYGWRSRAERRASDGNDRYNPTSETEEEKFLSVVKQEKPFVSTHPRGWFKGVYRHRWFELNSEEKELLDTDLMKTALGRGVGEIVLEGLNGEALCLTIIMDKADNGYVDPFLGEELVNCTAYLRKPISITLLEKEELEKTLKPNGEVAWETTHRQCVFWFKYGFQSKDLHEYFFDGPGNLTGRWVLIRPYNSESKQWHFIKPQDQEPYKDNLRLSLYIADILCEENLKNYI